MKVCVSIFVLVAISLAKASEEDVIKFKFSEDLANILIAAVKKGNYNDQELTVVVNDYADKILSNIRKFAVNHDLDPFPIGNVSANVLLADVELWEGSLNGISTLKRYEDIVVKYDHKTKTFGMVLPIEFVDLKFLYDYQIKVLGMGPKGSFEGEIKEFKFYLEFSFDIPNLVATIKKLKTTDSGHISITIHGNITDFIFNILSELATTILHPLLQGVIEGIIKKVANNLVDDINDFFYNLTHQNTLLYMEKFVQYIQ